MSTSWAEITCRAPSSEADLISDYLVTLSGTGVCTENRKVDTFSTDGLDDTEEVLIKAYFPEDDNLTLQVQQISSFLEQLTADGSGRVYPSPEVAIIRQEEWADTWKEYFKPFRVGRQLVIKPTWEEYPAGADDLILEIDPGMAFGTGSHETTKLCLEAIEGICHRSGPFAAMNYPTPVSCIDVGTGSGILGIGALKLGIESAVAIDIDPGAVTVAEENASLNGVSSRMTISATPLENIAGTFSVVVANILAEDLARMAPSLAGKISSGGFLILSGILTEKEPLVSAGFAPFDLSPLPPVREGEWSCLVYRRTS